MSACDAPTCEREAVTLATGTDYDGEPFTNVPLCTSCAEYIAEAGQERVTFSLMRRNMSDYCDPRDLDGPARARYLEERGLPLTRRKDGSEVSVYRGVDIVWTSTLDTRITLVVDAMPDAQRARLLTTYAHKGGCGFAWDGPPPVDYREGEMVTEDLVPDLNDSWYIDRSYDVNPPAQLPNRLAALPYDLYLETDHWKEVRARAIAHYGDSCVLCDRKPIQVHHRTYVRRGFEQLTDLIVLCDDCHSRYHGKTA